MTTMMRVSPETRERVLQVAQEDYDGASADETVRRLLDEHWQAKAVAVMDRFRTEDPDGWTAYLADADKWQAADAPVTDPWDEAA